MMLRMTHLLVPQILMEGNQDLGALKREARNLNFLNLVVRHLKANQNPDHQILIRATALKEVADNRLHHLEERMKQAVQMEITRMLRFKMK